MHSVIRSFLPHETLQSSRCERTVKNCPKHQVQCVPAYGHPRLFVERCTFFCLVSIVTSLVHRWAKFARIAKARAAVIRRLWAARTIKLQRQTLSRWSCFAADVKGAVIAVAVIQAPLPDLPLPDLGECEDSGKCCDESSLVALQKYP